IEDCGGVAAMAAGAALFWGRTISGGTVNCAANSKTSWGTLGGCGHVTLRLLQAWVKSDWGDPTLPPPPAPPAPAGHKHSAPTTAARQEMVKDLTIGRIAGLPF